MKYRRRRRIVTIWVFVIAFTMALFSIIFTVRQEWFVAKMRGSAANLKYEIVKAFSFSDEGALKEWDEKVFKNKVLYKVEKEGAQSYVRAVSDKSASALYYKIKLDAKNRRPTIRWRWQVVKFPAKARPESLEVENEDDFAARVYVIFPAMFITNSKVLEYIWSETIPVGTTGTSPYSKNIKLIVLEQGHDKDKKWFKEERDIYSDYVKLFGRPPEYDVGAIAFMTNTEHTITSAEAIYDDIEVGYGAQGGG
jgi:hypothetical protein